MLKHIFLPILVILLTVSACAQSVTPINFTPTPSTATPPAIEPTATEKAVSATPTPSSGIEGTVTEGPMCPGPVQVGNNTCPDQPYQATIVILNTNNTPVAQTQSNAVGFFKIELAPGTYIIHPVSDQPFPRTGDQTVTVMAGQYTQVTIMYDTGMR